MPDSGFGRDQVLNAPSCQYILTMTNPDLNNPAARSMLEKATEAILGRVDRMFKVLHTLCAACIHPQKEAE